MRGMILVHMTPTMAQRVYDLLSKLAWNREEHELVKALGEALGRDAAACSQPSS